MPIPPNFDNLRLPVIAAPLFLISNPDMVVQLCGAGIIGTFPALNCRTTEDFIGWLADVDERLHNQESAAPWGVNLIVHKTNSRLKADLNAVVEHKVPLVITSLGAVKDVVDAVHSYGGLVFHDVISHRHAEKAVEAGVDGIIAVCAGAGGHAGTLSPFAFVPEIRSLFLGTIVVSGAISSGGHVAAVRAMGADMAYIGTRFIATQEAEAAQAHKQMIVDAGTVDLIYTPAISGVNANFLRPSIVAAGMDPDALDHQGSLNVANEARAWKTVWSAGQGAAAIDDIPKLSDLCERLEAEYEYAAKALNAAPFVNT